MLWNTVVKELQLAGSRKRAFSAAFPTVWNILPTEDPTLLIFQESEDLALPNCKGLTTVEVGGQCLEASPSAFKLFFILVLLGSLLLIHCILTGSPQLTNTIGARTPTVKQGSNCELHPNLWPLLL